MSSGLFAALQAACLHAKPAATGAADEERARAAQTREPAHPVHTEAA